MEITPKNKDSKLYWNCGTRYCYEFYTLSSLSYSSALGYPINTAKAALKKLRALVPTEC